MPIIARFRHHPIYVTARDFLDWWLSELVELVPHRFRPPVSHSWIMPEAHRVSVIREREGVGERFVEETPISAFDQDQWAQLQDLVAGTTVSLLLSDEDVFDSRLSLPAAARARLDSAVSLALPEEAPLKTDDILWVRQAPQLEKERLFVRVSMAKRSTVRRLQDVLDAHEISATRVFLSSAGDRLPLGARIQLRLGRQVKLLCLCVGLVATIPLTTLIMSRWLIHITEQQVQILQARVTPKLAVDRRARRAEELRRGLARLGQEPPVIQLLNGLAASVPSTAWLRSFQRDAQGRIIILLDAEDGEEALLSLRRDPLIGSIRVVERQPTEKREQLTIEARSR